MPTGATMDYDGFVGIVQEAGQIPREEAERVSCATVRTLAERVTSGEAEDLVDRLPGKLSSCVDTDHRPERFDVAEFVRRIAQRAEVDPESAPRDAQAVLVALWRAVGSEEFKDLRAQLPKDFDPLLDEALSRVPSPAFDAPEPAGGLSAEEIVGRVAQRMGQDRESAQRALEAVLQELAIRITAGQVEDLELRLPRALRPPLERGLSRSFTARPLALDTFLEGIARLEGADRSSATEHARAVLTTLREAVGEDEWTDTTAQLPRDYRALWTQG
jgi:uncharacterized protein (DUF2267 family)